MTGFPAGCSGVYALFMHRAVFLDRDDTLIANSSLAAPDPMPSNYRAGDLTDPGRVKLLPGARDACLLLKEAGFKLIVVTNQGAVARGTGTEADVKATNSRVNELISAGHDEPVIDGFYFCPYHPMGSIAKYTKEHPWRKPGPGMILQASEDHNLDLGQSWMIGDAERDVQAGLAAGLAQSCCLRIGSDQPHRSALEAARHIIETDQLCDVSRAVTMAASDAVQPTRLLVVMPSWIGDVVMATPALRLIRERLPAAYIGALVRPGVEQVLAGTDLVDELHVQRAKGVMGTKLTASIIRKMRYDTALLLTNSFSTALVARLAFIKRRIGYNRDGRGVLLTDKLVAPRLGNGSWAIVPAVRYYWDAALALVGEAGDTLPADPLALPEQVHMELGTTAEEEHLAERILHEARIKPGDRLTIINPGGNNAAKRWPGDRYAALADYLADKHGMKVLINGSPNEADLVQQIALHCQHDVVQLCEHGNTIGSLKAIVRRCQLMVTNDTGPRHIAAAFGVPVVSLFGPTDHRWTLIPKRDGALEIILLANEGLGMMESANDDPVGNRIELIEACRVIEAVDQCLEAGEGV